MLGMYEIKKNLLIDNRLLKKTLLQAIENNALSFLSMVKA